MIKWLDKPFDLSLNRNKVSKCSGLLHFVSIKSFRKGGKGGLQPRIEKNVNTKYRQTGVRETNCVFFLIISINELQIDANFFIHLNLATILHWSELKLICVSISPDSRIKNQNIYSVIIGLKRGLKGAMVSRSWA